VDASIELGDETLRRDDPVALLDPVAEELERDTLRVHRDVDPPGASEPMPVGAAPSIARAWWWDSASLTVTSADSSSRPKKTKI
jgi:hypothetical protein